MRREQSAPARDLDRDFRIVSRKVAEARAAMRDGLPERAFGPMSDVLTLGRVVIDAIAEAAVKRGFMAAKVKKKDR